MSPKPNPGSVNIERGNNNSISNVGNSTKYVDKSVHHHHVPAPSKPNWLVRSIVGGLIALCVSVFGYYFKKNMDSKSQLPVIGKQENVVKLR